MLYLYLFINLSQHNLNAYLFCDEVIRNAIKFVAGGTSKHHQPRHVKASSVKAANSGSVCMCYIIPNDTSTTFFKRRSRT